MPSPEGAVPAAIVDPSYMFAAVNQFLQQSGQPPLFKVQFVGLTREVALNEGAVIIRSDQLLADAAPCGLVIIPALSGDLHNRCTRLIAIATSGAQFLIEQGSSKTKPVAANQRSDGL